MNNKKHKNTISRGIVGSCLYGTNTERSDKDLVEVYVPENYELFKLDGKNKPKQEILGETDTTVYDIASFLRAFKKGSFQHIEYMYSKNNGRIDSKIFNLVDHFKYNLISKEMIMRNVRGYAKAKMNNIMDNLKDSTRLCIILSDYVLNYCSYTLSDLLSLNNLSVSSLDKKFIIRLMDEAYAKDPKNIFKNIIVDGYKIPMDKYIIDIYSELKELPDVKNQMYNYDNKNAYHILRILEQAYQLLVSGSISFPFNESTSNLLKGIKNNKVELEVFIFCYNKTLTRIQNTESHIFKEHTDDNLFDLIYKEIISVSNNNKIIPTFIKIYLSKKKIRKYIKEEYNE